MHTLLVFWGKVDDGSQFTLHETETLHDSDIMWSIDMLDDPSDTEHVVLDDFMVPELTKRERMQFLECGFLDSERIEEKLQKLWDRLAPSKGKVARLTGRQKSKSQSRYIYLMKDKANGLYKIGKSINPALRERTLQSEKPSIRMVFSTREREGFNEASLHRQYADQRKRGEWFTLSAAQVRYICSTGIGSAMGA